MENVRGTHTEQSSGWFSTFVGVVTRMKRRSDASGRGLVVTPWSGRSPTGWSA